jgi:SNF2 family DNA or RNA helicase
MAPGSRRIPHFGAIPEDAEVIDIDDIPDSNNMTHGHNDENVKVEIKVEPGIDISSSPAGLGNSILRPKQPVPPRRPMDSESHHAQQRAIFAQFLTNQEDLRSEQDSSGEQAQDSSESEEQIQNPVEQERQFLQDKAVYMEKKRGGTLTEEDERDFMRKESAYSKRKRDLAALMEDDEEEDEDPLFEPPEVALESGTTTVQTDKRPRKKARTSKSNPRYGVSRASKLRQPGIPNLRGHANFWENADAAEQMATEPNYEDVGRGGRKAGLNALKKQVRREAWSLDSKRLESAMKSFTNSKGVARNMRGIEMLSAGWTVKGMLTSLKNYQIINCGQEMRTSEPRGGILADQMGLGKTVTCLANIVNGRPLKTFPPHLRPKSHTTLIVVPSSLVGQWYTEIKRHAKSEATRRTWGLGSTKIFKDSQSERYQAGEFEASDIILTTYHDVRSSWPNCEIPEGLSEAERKAFFMENIYEKRGPLHRQHFLRIVLDEGHLIANPDTQVAKACFNLVADHKWVLTGTP